MTVRKAIPNPFDSDVVTDPDRPSETDVPAIHVDVFERCQRAYERVAAAKHSWSVLLYGEAGCGKTHLLSRFRKWLAGDLETKPSVPPILFVAVRMQTGPDHIWRHLRRRFIEETLRRGPDGETTLDIILKRYAAGNAGSLSEAFDNAPVRDLGLDLIRVLEHFAEGRHRRVCRAWLLGDGISDADLQLLNVPRADLAEIDEDIAEYESRRIVLAITRLCAPAPVVFCFDQIEAIGLGQQSHSYGSFSRMGASLLDEVESGNSLVISTILATFLQKLQDGSTFSDYQRIAGKDLADLHPLTLDLGKQIIDKRLSLIPELGNEKPIPEEDLIAYYRTQRGAATPRRLIHEARRLFSVWQGQPDLPRLSTNEFLRAEFDRIWNGSEALTNPGATDNILAHGLPVALEILHRPTLERPSKNIDLAVHGDNSRVLVAFGNQTNMTSFANWLKRFKQQSAPGSTLCVIRDERLPISPKAKVALQQLHEIQHNEGRVVRVAAEALAALDAMRKLLARATSGEISLNGDTIAPKTVQEWLAGNLPNEIAKLAEQIFGEHLRPEGPPDALLELLQKRKVVPLEDAALLTELHTEQIKNYARAHPDRIGLFGGACPVVCQAIQPSAQGDAVGSS